MAKKRAKMGKNDDFGPSCPAARAFQTQKSQDFLEVAVFEKKIYFSALPGKRVFQAKNKKIFKNFDEIYTQKS